MKADMKNAMLFYKNGEIVSFFERVVDERVGKQYSQRQVKKITQNILTDPDAAVEYSTFCFRTQCEVKAEIEQTLGFAVDVGFDPDAATKALTDRVGDLENSQSELNEALTMILEGVTE